MPKDISSGSDTIYARINPEDKNWLKTRVQKEPGWSENLVIAALVKYFRSLSEIDQQNLVAGDSVFASFDEIFHRGSWLQHAFGQKFWQWALDECYELAKICERGSYALWTFAQYRAAFCWLEIAILLRREAIKFCRAEFWDQCYEAADWAICASLVHNRCHSAGRPGLDAEKIFNAPSRHPLVAYNLACGMSLRARYSIERKLGPEQDFFAHLAEEIQEQDKATPEQIEEFENIPKNWREDVKTGDREGFVGKVGRHVEEAMKELRRLKVPDSFPKGMLPRDKDFLHRYAPQDPDLALLKWDEIFKKEFDLWKQSDGGEVVTLCIFEQARENAPDGVRRLVKEWRLANPLS